VESLSKPHLFAIPHLFLPDSPDAPWSVGVTKNDSPVVLRSGISNGAKFDLFVN
jgi:hypothetical protein